jgi:membrane protein
MMRRLRTVFPAAYRSFSEEGGMFFAQALAFNAIFAIFPIGLLLLSVLAFIYGDDKGRADFHALIRTLAPAVQDIVNQNFDQLVSFRSLSGLIGLVTLVWSSKNLFLGLTYSLDKALKVPRSRHFVIDISLAIFIMPAIGLIMIAATIVPIVLSFFIHLTRWQGPRELTQLATYGAGTILVFIIAALLYAVLPNTKLPWTFGIPGAAATALAWLVAQIAFAVYSTHVNFLMVYGALASLAILGIYFYYQATIFLFGAHVSAQWAAYSRDHVAAVPAELSARTA